MEDRRKRKTREAITTVFLELLETKSLNRITVAELSRTADLGRGTFYLHYKDVYDLYETIERETYQALADIYDMTTPNDNMDSLSKLTDMITDFIVDHKQLFRLFVRTDGPSTSLRKLKEFFYEKVAQETRMLIGSHAPFPDAYDTEAIFIVSGVVGVLETWIRNDFLHSPRYISSMLQELILRTQTPTLDSRLTS